MINFISSNFNDIESITVRYNDGETETINTTHPPTRQRQHNTRRVGQTTPTFPPYQPSIPITRSMVNNNSQIDTLLAILKFESHINISYVRGTSIQHIVDMITMSRKHINLLKSMNAIFNYQLRKNCKHASENLYHSRCQVCPGVIHLLNLYPEQSNDWICIFNELEQELSYPVRHITTVLKQEQFQNWMVQQRIARLTDLVSIDKTPISNSIRVGKFLHKIFMNTASNTLSVFSGSYSETFTN